MELIRQEQCNVHEYFAILKFYDIDEVLSLCIRCTKRRMKLKDDFETFNTLEIVQISVNEKYRRQGVASYFIEEFEKLCKETKRLCYIECVLNEILMRHLEKKGYSVINENCYFKLIY